MSREPTLNDTLVNLCLGLRTNPAKSDSHENPNDEKYKVRP